MSKRLTDHDIVDESGNELMHKINQRNQFPKNSMAFSRVMRFLF